VIYLFSREEEFNVFYQSVAPFEDIILESKSRDTGHEKHFSKILKFKQQCDAFWFGSIFLSKNSET
jgi:hypothetical protein